MWCQPNGDINITKLSHWTPNSGHGDAAFYWPGSTSAQNKPASTDISQWGLLASGDQTHFILQLSPPILGWNVEIFQFSNLVSKIWFFIAWEIPGTGPCVGPHHGIVRFGLILCKLMINDPGCWIKSGQQETKTRPLIQWSHIISIGSPIVYTIASHSKV